MTASRGDGGRSGTDRSSPDVPEATTGGDRRGPLWDAGHGALVTLALSVIPFSPLAGGVVAAYRSGAGYLDGVALGLLAGILAALPLALLLVPAVRAVAWLGAGVAPSSPAYPVFLGLVAAMFLAYTVGLSTVGGAVGVWARRHTDWTLDPGRWL